MRKNRISAFALLLGATLLLGLGCGTKEEPSVAPAPPANAGTQTPSAAAPPAQSLDATQKPNVSEAVTTAVNALLSESETGVPKGTRLLSAEFDAAGKIVTLNFSKEFNQLIDAGESVESEAQKSLRKSLAVVAEVEKMRVHVEGKPFESQATDWETPFSVRGKGASSERSARNEAQGEAGQ